MRKNKLWISPKHFKMAFTMFLPFLNQGEKLVCDLFSGLEFICRKSMITLQWKNKLQAASPAQKQDNLTRIF